MPTATHLATRLAYDSEGAGPPVVLLHGLTFNRRTWRPIVDKLGRSIRSIAIDLPAHGESGGAPAPLDEVAGQVHELLASLGVERPVVVGHSMSGGLAFMYASAYPARGVVVVDQGLDVRPFAETLHRIEPALRGPAFASAFQTVRGQPRPGAHSGTVAVLRARKPHRHARGRRWVLGSAHACGSGRVPGVDRRAGPRARRPVPRRARAAVVRRRSRALRLGWRTSSSRSGPATATSSIWSTPAVSPRDCGSSSSTAPPATDIDRRDP